MDYLATVIETAMEIGATKALENLGLTSGEISQNKALQLYGSWFAEADREGRIRPIRIGEGRNGKRTYRVTDILALRTKDAAKAMLKL